MDRHCQVDVPSLDTAPAVDLPRHATPCPRPTRSAWVYEGENPIATKNTPLGRVELSVPSECKPHSPVWVTFSLNQSRVLEVSSELPDYPQSKVTINLAPSSAMSAEEQERIRSEHSSRRSSGQAQGADMGRVERTLSEVEQILKHNRPSIDPVKVAECEKLMVVVRDAVSAGRADKAAGTLTQLAALARQIKMELA